MSGRGAGTDSVGPARASAGTGSGGIPDSVCRRAFPDASRAGAGLWLGGAGRRNGWADAGYVLNIYPILYTKNALPSRGRPFVNCNNSFGREGGVSVPCPKGCPLHSLHSRGKRGNPVCIVILPVFVSRVEGGAGDGSFFDGSFTPPAGQSGLSLCTQYRCDEAFGPQKPMSGNASLTRARRSERSFRSGRRKTRLPARTQAGRAAGGSEPGPSPASLSHSPRLRG